MVEVTVSKEEFDKLVQDSLWREAMETAGCDNWEGYDYAMEVLEDLENALTE